MDSELFNCELCFHPFDGENHKPRFIPECGHTLCTACLLTLLPQMSQENEFQCPLDKAQVHIPEKDISVFPPNLSLIKIMDASMSPTKRQCSMHQKEANLLCIDHNSYICEDCALFGVHSGHTIQKVVEFETEFDAKNKEVNEIIGKIDLIKQKFDHEADSLIENRRNVLMTLLQDEFDAILNTFLAKKESITRELTDYFYTLSQDIRQQSSTLKEIDSNLFNLVRWREQVLKKQDDKRFLEGRGSPIKILQDDINDIKPQVDDYLNKQQGLFDLSVLQEKIQQARVSVNSSFFTSIDHFFSFQTQESDKNAENRIRERESVYSKMSVSSPQLEKPFADFLETPDDPKADEEQERFHYILKTLDLDVLWRQTEKGKVLNLRENTKKSSAKPFWQKMYNTLLRTKDMSASFQHIKTLDLVCKEFTDAGASNLGRALEKLVNLEKLQINFEENKATSSEGISSLGHSLGCLVNLRELTLNFTRSPKIGSKSLSSISQGLSKLVNLQRLRLVFEGCPLIDDQGLAYMSSSLIYLASLTKLELRFNGCNLITDTGVTKVSNLVIDLAQLQKIKLDFTGCVKITNTGVARLGQALTKTTNLETLVLSFREAKDINDNGFAQIAQALSKSTSLKHLELDFAKCYKISNHSLLELTQAFIYLPLVQKLVLRFGLCEGIDDQGFTKLVQTIGSLEHLLRLTLDFNNYQIRTDRLTEKSFITLAASLLKLISLRHLELGFEGFTTMGDRSLAQLSGAISGLINLREVVLDFTGCKAITDNGVEKLGGIMPELMNLTLLWIILKGCDQITAQAKEELRAAMGKLNNSNGQFSIEY